MARLPACPKLPDEPLRVCHLISGDLWAGAEVQAATLMAELACRADLRVRAILFNRGELGRRLERDGIPVTVLPESEIGLPGLVWRSRRVLSRERIELVHAHGHKEHLVGGLAARLAGVGAIVRTHHGKGMLNRGGVHRWVEAAGARWWTDRMIAVSAELGEFLPERLPCPGKIRVIRNGIAAGITEAGPAAPSARADLGIPADAPVVGTVGRLVAVKGHDLFLQAAARVSARRPETAFVIVGEGPMLAELQELAARLSVGRLHWTGFRTDTLDLMRSFDVFVLPSRHEGTPMALLEAMGLGRAVAATAVGGVPEVITDGIDGRLAPAADVEALAAVILELLENPDARRRLGEAARRTVRCRFSLELSAEQTAVLYRELARPVGRGGTLDDEIHPEPR